MIYPFFLIGVLFNDFTEKSLLRASLYQFNDAPN